MKTRELDTQPASNKWWAKKDANLLNLRWESTYSESQKLKASRVRGCLDLVYGSRGVHINFREKWIAVKVDRPVIRDRKNLIALENDWESQGILRRDTPQGIIYRIPRD